MSDTQSTGKTLALCFLVGGIYGLIGQLIGIALESVVGPGLAAPLTLVCLGVLAVILYTPGIHQKIAAVSSFGSILPFNGFACGIADAFQAGHANDGGFAGGLKSVGKLFFHVIVLSSAINMAAGVLDHFIAFPKLTAPAAVPMPAALCAGFVAAGCVCLVWHLLYGAVGQPAMPDFLLASQSLGGILSLFGVTDVLASLGGYSFKILILGAGQAVEATTALCFSAGPANLLITWGTFFALAFFGILAANLNLNLNLKVKGDK